MEHYSSDVSYDIYALELKLLRQRRIYLLGSTGQLPLNSDRINVACKQEDVDTLPKLIGKLHHIKRMADILRSEVGPDQTAFEQLRELAVISARIEQLKEIEAITNIPKVTFSDREFMSRDGLIESLLYYNIYIYDNIIENYCLKSRTKINKEGKIQCSQN